MKVKFHGTSFGLGVFGLTDGKEYECIGVEYGLLRIIDDEGEDYLYSATVPGPANGSVPHGKWEVIEDDAEGTLNKAVNLKYQ